MIASCEFGGGPPASPVATGSGEVAFELAGAGGAALLIPVHINGSGPYDFVLDTGATFTCLGPTLRDQLELPERRGGVGFGAGVGGSGQVQLVRADSIRVGGAAAEDVTLCVIDLGQLEATGISVDGLLGLNFLRQFHVTLDFERNVASFE